MAGVKDFLISRKVIARVGNEGAVMKLERENLPRYMAWSPDEDRADIDRRYSYVANYDASIVSLLRGE